MFRPQAVGSIKTISGVLDFLWWPPQVLAPFTYFRGLIPISWENCKITSKGNSKSTLPETTQLILFLTHFKEFIWIFFLLLSFSVIPPTHPHTPTPCKRQGLLYCRLAEDNCGHLAFLPPPPKC